MKTLITVVLSFCLLVSGFVPAIRVITSPAKPSTSQSLTAAKKEPYKPVTLNCRITVYTPFDDGGVWGYETATGAKSEHLATCAVDPEYIPLGSLLKVSNGETVLLLKAVDTGSAVKGNHIDIFYDGTIPASEKWADSFGEFAEVTVYSNYKRP